MLFGVSRCYNWKPDGCFSAFEFAFQFWESSFVHETGVAWICIKQWHGKKEKHQVWNCQFDGHVFVFFWFKFRWEQYLSHSFFSTNMTMESAVMSTAYRLIGASPEKDVCNFHCSNVKSTTIYKNASAGTREVICYLEHHSTSHGLGPFIVFALEVTEYSLRTDTLPMASTFGLQ